jgi:alanine racemase
VRIFSGLDITYIHCGNTAAALSGLGDLGLGGERTLIRPGIGIYGYSDVPCAVLEPALKLRARVLESRRLAAGERVGYGATFQVTRPCRQSILSIGYGDGFFRALSNAHIRVGGRDTAVLGRVSMDLTSLKASGARAGQWVTLVGEDRQQAVVMAAAAGTIVYEILTAISQRVPRFYLGGA